MISIVSKINKAGISLSIYQLGSLFFEKVNCPQVEERRPNHGRFGHNRWHETVQRIDGVGLGQSRVENNKSIGRPRNHKNHYQMSYHIIYYKEVYLLISKYTKRMLTNVNDHDEGQASGQ